MGVIERTKKEYDEGGLSQVLIEKIRKHLHLLPDFLTVSQRKVYNGIEVGNKKKLPFWVRDEKLTGRRPNYEQGLINSIEENVSPKDKVTILGGGSGTTTVKAALENQDPEKLTVYEGSKEQIRIIEETLSLNNCKDVEVNYAVVGPPKHLKGDYSDAERVSPSELEPCDVLEMDIEGSEKEVIERMEIEPETVIVETHGFQGSPTETIKEKLRGKGYKIKNVELAEPKKKCREDDINVVTAKKD